jgi:hypothetical protein
MMRSVLITALATAAAAEILPRDAASDFTSAADELISSYIPEDKFKVMTESLGPAAESASVTGDISSIIFSALNATDPPSWFEDAIPTQFKEEVSALESAIDNLRPVETVVEVTTTNSDGSTVTTDMSTTILKPQTRTSTGTTVTTDDQGNTVTQSFTTTETVTPTPNSEGEGDSSSSEDFACMPTAMAHAAAGVAALVGAAMVL